MALLDAGTGAAAVLGLEASGAATTTVAGVVVAGDGVDAVEVTWVSVAGGGVTGAVVVGEVFVVLAALLVFATFAVCAVEDDCCAVLEVLLAGTEFAAVLAAAAWALDLLALLAT